MIKVLIPCILLPIFCFSFYAHAIFGIPGTPKIYDPLDVAREAERYRRCQQIREDADKHIQYYNQQISHTNNNLSIAQQRLADNQADKILKQEELENLIQMLKKQIANLDLFNSLNQYSVEIEAIIKKLLKDNQIWAATNVWQRMADTTTNSSLREKLQQLQQAHLQADIQNLLLKGYHFNDCANIIIKSLVEIENNLQLMLMEKEKCLQVLNVREQNLNDQIQGLIQEIRQATQEKNKQEERKSCNF